MKTLTETQRCVLNAVRQRIEAGNPPPSYRDLCAEFGWSSTGTARDHLRALQRKGYVDLPRRRGGRVTLRSKKPSDAGASDGGSGVGPTGPGMSPYATGGGGVTFERKVAVQYLTHLLVGDGACGLGVDRRVVSVAFQQAPDHPVDDLVVHAARSDELKPSLVLAVAVRRSPRLVSSDEEIQKLVRAFVDAVRKAPTDGPEHRWCLVVAGPQPHAQQLAKLAGLAKAQMDAAGFFDLVRTPGKFDAATRGRLDQIEKLVKRALDDLGAADADTVRVQQHTWQLLAGLSVLMPRLESPDETNWSAVVNSLVPVARDSDLVAASRLRDRLVALAAEYSPRSARVDLKMLRRDAHAVLDPTMRRHQTGWRTLDRLHRQALASVRNNVKEIDGDRCVCLDRSAAATALAETVAGNAAVVIRGESGVGKSALALFGLSPTNTTGSDGINVLGINLRHIPKLTVEFEALLTCQLSTLLCELSAPQRILIIDGADAVAEGSVDAFRYLVAAAHASDVKVVTVSSVDSKQVVWDTVTERFGAGVAEYAVAPLTDAEIDEITKTFNELANLGANPRSRELLRRLVVVDLLVRGGVRGVPLSDADAMREVWSGLVRRREMSDRGFPDARESVLLELASLALDHIGSVERLDVIRALDSEALAGLRRDGLLQTPRDNRFKIGLDFGHDEVRRYAVARLLLADRVPASRIMTAGAPRWSLAAARLACQELLAEPDTPTTPLRGRFAALQKSFDALVDAGHGARWGDVPGEALLTLANPGVVLRDAWPELCTDDATGLRRIARLVKQRLCADNGIVDHIAVEPVITLLLEDKTPWLSGDYAQDLFRDWLCAHAFANTAAGHPARMLLRQRLVDACTAADRRLAQAQQAAAAARAARTPEEVEEERRLLENHRELFSEIGYSGRRHRLRPEIAREITDEIVVELLALLGPDLGEDGEAILRRLARDAPQMVAPAVEEPLAGRALSNCRRGLLAHLTEAYYLDDEADGSGLSDDGIRDHQTRSFNVVPLAAWYRGPFMPLFQTDFRNGVAVLNRLLNHAARIRVRTLTRLDRSLQPLEDDTVDAYQTQLEITGARLPYVGDQHVWLWYRGTGVGPYPCFSALQALERVCDQLIEIGIPIRNVVSILLDGCENLAMVGFVVGLLIRHLEKADRLLDTYLTEPAIWHHEFGRVVSESGGFAADSEGLVAPERRNWSLRDAAMFMVLRAEGERVAELRVLGEQLVANAQCHIESTPPTHADESRATNTAASDSIELQLAPVRAWASGLDRDTYQAQETPDGLYIQTTPPQDVVRALRHSNEELERTREKARLTVRYYIEPQKGGTEVVGTDDLTADVAIARRLLENPPTRRANDPWDTPALVAAAAIEARFLRGAELANDTLSFAADTVLRIGEGDTQRRQYESADTFFEQGADRSAARALPLLLVPAAAPLRAVVDEADGSTTFGRAVRAGANLARASANEVRLHLARGLDHVWETPCVAGGLCHHDVGLQLATDTMRDCILADWNPDAARRSVVALGDPVRESLADTQDDSILEYRLDAAIRALAPAATAGICVSTRARDLLLILLDAQRRSLLSQDHRNADHRGSRSLVSARALLTLAADGDDATIYEQIDAYADNAALLSNLLRALSAAAEETPSRAATARRIWPQVVCRVLELNESGHAPFQGRHYGDLALAALVPNAAGEVQYLYREVQHKPITWWEPLALVSEVEMWLEAAAGNAKCVDQLISFLHVITPVDQARTGLPWVNALVLPGPARIAGRTFLLTDWLIDTRSAAVDAGLLADWQEVVDALVVAGVTRLAPYSE